jgi:hypothetical protein
MGRNTFDSKSGRWMAKVFCGHCKLLKLKDGSPAVMNAYGSAEIPREVYIVFEIHLIIRFPTTLMNYQHTSEFGIQIFSSHLTQRGTPFPRHSKNHGSNPLVHPRNSLGQAGPIMLISKLVIVEITIVIHYIFQMRLLVR